MHQSVEMLKLKYSWYKTLKIIWDTMKSPSLKIIGIKGGEETDQGKNIFYTK